MARTIVENLSLGINPMSGQVLDDNVVCASETVQEALRVVLEHCSLESYKTKAHERSPEKRKEKREYLSAQARSFESRWKMKRNVNLHSSAEKEKVF